jgi:uncharacterized protein (TIRG00374 family)
MRSWVVGVVLAAALLALLLVRVDGAALAASLSDARLVPLAAMLALKVVAMLVKAFRWGLAIEAGAGVRPREGLVSASMVGFAANLVMPARLGELARVMVLRRHLPVARMLTLTSVGIVQLFDLAALALVVAAFAFWGAAAGMIARGPVLALGFGLVAVFVGLEALRRGRERLRPRVERAAARLPAAIGARVVAFFDHFHDALRVLQKPRLLAGLVVLTAVVWLLELVATVLALAAFHVDVSLPAAALVMAALNLAFVVPITPGGIGTHQLVSVVILRLFGVDEARALAFSLALQGSVLATTLAIGAFFAWREGIDLAALRRADSER